MNKAWARDARHKQYLDNTGQIRIVPSVTTLLGARTMVSQYLDNTGQIRIVPSVTTLLGARTMVSPPPAK